MTLAVQSPRLAVIGNGTRGPFAFTVSGVPIRVDDSADLVVTRYTSTSATTGTVLTLGSDYSVSGLPSAPTVTLDASQTVLASTERLVLERRQDFDQDLNLTTGGNFSAEALETRLDKLTQFVQELRVEAGRNLKQSWLETTAIELPPVAARKGKLLSFDATTGAPTVAVGDTNIAISSYWQSVLGTNDKEAIASLLDSLPIFQTLAALQAATPSANSDACAVLGRTTAGDWGKPRVARWDGSDLSTEVAADEVDTGLGNGGYFVAPSTDRTGASGAWRFDRTGTTLLEYYGAKGDFDFVTETGTDNSPMVQTLLDNAISGETITSLPGAFRFTVRLEVTGKHLKFLGSIGSRPWFIENSDGIEVNNQSLHPFTSQTIFQDMMFLTSESGAKKAITYNGARSAASAPDDVKFKNVHCYGVERYAARKWSTNTGNIYEFQDWRVGIEVNDCDGAVFEDCSIVGREGQQAANYSGINTTGVLCNDTIAAEHRNPEYVNLVDPCIIRGQSEAPKFTGGFLIGKYGLRFDVDDPANDMTMTGTHIAATQGCIDFSAKLTGTTGAAGLGTVHGCLFLQIGQQANFYVFKNIASFTTIYGNKFLGAGGLSDVTTFHFSSSTIRCQVFGNFIRHGAKTFVFDSGSQDNICTDNFCSDDGTSITAPLVTDNGTNNRVFQPYGARTLPEWAFHPTPKTDSTYDLGTTTKRWRAAYADDLYARNMILSGGKVFDVRAYGAVGDDSTDDTAAFVAAWAAALAVSRPTVWIPAGYVFKLSTVTAPFDMVSNMIIDGGGEIHWVDHASSPTYLFGYPSGSATRLSNVTIRNVRLRGAHGEGSDYTQEAHYPILLSKTDGVKIENVEVSYSRVMGIAATEVSDVLVTGCRVHHCARDGIHVQGSGVRIIGNDVRYCDDDGIAVHNTVFNEVDRVSVISANTMVACQGIRCLAAQSITIVGNTLDFCIHQGINVYAEPYLAANGSLSPGIGVSIIGNTIKNCVDRDELDSLNTGAPYIFIGGASNQAGSLAAIPGEHDAATGTVINPYPYFDEAQGGASTGAIPGSYHYTIMGNICVRDRDVDGKLSDLGYQGFYLRSGPTDPTLTAAMFDEPGLLVGTGVIKNVTCSGNIFSGIQTGMSISSGAKLRNFKFHGNMVYDCANGVVFAGADHHSVEIWHNTFDLDPFFKSGNRYESSGAYNGTWLADGNPTGITLGSASGLDIRGNTYRNLCRLYDLSPSTLANLIGTRMQIADEIAECGPIAFGFNAANEGVGNIPLGVALRIVECNPDEAAFGQVVNMCPNAAPSVPTSGTYMRGHFVRNSSPSSVGALGQRYVVLGWTRLTNGSGHTVGTDWAEVRGQYEQFSILDAQGYVVQKTAGATAIADITNAINTTGKAIGRTVYDTTNARIMVSNGSAAGSAWYVADGSASVTPS